MTQVFSASEACQLFSHLATLHLSVSGCDVLLFFRKDVEWVTYSPASRLSLHYDTSAVCLINYLVWQRSGEASDWYREDTASLNTFSLQTVSTFYQGHRVGIWINIFILYCIEPHRFQCCKRRYSRLNVSYWYRRLQCAWKIGHHKCKPNRFQLTLQWKETAFPRSLTSSIEGILSFYNEWKSIK